LPKDKKYTTPEQVVAYLKNYSLNKKLHKLLEQINPLLAKKETNIRIHLDALLNLFITEEEYQTIETKMELGRLCLDLEEQIKDGFVTMMFYDWNGNKIYNGAAPSFSPDFFDFYEDINLNNSFNENIGTCGEAVFHRKVAVGNIATYPGFSGLREYYEKHGFYTAWSIPFFKGNEVIGAFAIYHKYCKKVTEKEIELVTQKIAEYENAIFQMSNQLVMKQV
jgi:hypothetical protein